MPTIKRLHKQRIVLPYKHDNKSAKYYNSKGWHNLRNSYIKEHPVCECCLMMDRVTPTLEIHHRIPFLTGINDDDKWDLLLDKDNLIGLCRRCHKDIHLGRIHIDLDIDTGLEYVREYRNNTYDNTTHNR